LEEKVLEIENEINILKSLEEERVQQNTRAAQLQQQIIMLRNGFEDWNAKGRQRLDEIIEMLRAANFSLADRIKLAEIDQRLKLLGYDAEAHDATRRAELAGRTSENNLRELESARAALIPLEREMLDLESQILLLRTRLAALSTDFDAAQLILNDLTANTPDLHQAEQALLDAQERENILTREVGAAQQKVNVLQDLRLRKSGFEKQREELARQIKNLKTLERAFGKDGVPALLIEQALPQIEEKANELLDRLSNGSMSVRFVTQAEFKDKKRDDLKETLDIRISDESGTRDYEMFSGGEAFRVNFAIRLALSEVLARRTGARLQTLVIDEGFGSQDTEGRQRLVEAINQVKSDFAKILIITHLDELKDAFPNRIEVEKTPRGSSVRVL
jgi:exonuclease SbcC